jgi:ABC-2 type transport system permease protein
MIRRIWAVVQKEFIQTVRDRSTLVMLLIMPMIQLVLLGFAIDMNVDHIPIVVADQSLDEASRAYVDAMVASSYFDVIGSVPDEEAVIEAIDAGRAQGGIVIPPGMAAAQERGEAQVLFLIDGSDMMTTQSAYSAATVIAQSYAMQVMVEQIDRSGLPFDASSPLDTRTRVLYNPDMDQLWFAIPGLVAMILQSQSIGLTALAIVREREIGTMEQVLVTPIRPMELLLGKVVPNIVVAFVNMGTVVALGVFCFRVPFRGNVGLFLQLSLLYVFSGLGLGLLVSTVSKNSNQTSQLLMAIMLIGILLGGYMFPRYTMPPLLYGLGYLFPMTYFIPISRGIIAKGVGMDALWPYVLPMAAYIVLLLLVASRAFRRRLD